MIVLVCVLDAKIVRNKCMIKFIVLSILLHFWIVMLSDIILCNTETSLTVSYLTDILVIYDLLSVFRFIIFID